MGFKKRKLHLKYVNNNTIWLLLTAFFKYLKDTTKPFHPSFRLLVSSELI